jgi:hypothetical protein
MAVQELQGTGLHNQGPALVVPGRYPVNDAEGHAVEGEFEGERGPDRAGADHQDVAVVRHGD